jgi:hypothetical protein
MKKSENIIHEQNLCKSRVKHHSSLILMTPSQDKVQVDREWEGDDYKQQREEMKDPGHEPSELGFSRPLWKIITKCYTHN